MFNSDFGSAFSEPDPNDPASIDDKIIDISLDDLDQVQDNSPAIIQVEPDKLVSVDLMLPQQLAAQRYGVMLTDPERGEDLFVGVTRNPDKRTEEEEYYPVFSSERRHRQVQIFTFEIEVPDQDGNPLEFVPVEVRGHEISGVLPSDSTPVAVYGMRDAKDGVVRTYKVVNLRTRSSLRITVRSREWCFLATAVYGSVNAPEVIILRLFRDKHLTRTFWGRWFVRTYYYYSPALTRWVAARPYRLRLAKIFTDKIVCLVRTNDVR